MGDDTPAPLAEAASENALLSAWAGRSDREALGELFSRCRPQAYALALRICGRAAAEDAVQDAFLKAMRQARAWRGGSARGWLLVIVANTARDAVRGETRRIRREATHSQPTSMPEPTDKTDLLNEVRAAFDELPMHERTALELHCFAGLDLESAAVALGRPYKTVHSQIGRGLDRLRDILGRRGVTVSLAVLSAALAAPADAAEPPGLAPAVQHLVASGPVPSLVWMKSALVAAGVTLMTTLAWSLTPSARPIPVIQALTADQPLALDPFQRVLELPVQVRFRHDRLDEALAALARALPAGSGFRYAIADGVAASWEGLTWTPEDKHSVRQALDALSAQAGLAWTAQGGVVVVHAPVSTVTDAHLQAAIAALVEPVDPNRTPAEADRDGISAVMGRHLRPSDRLARLPGIGQPDGLARLLAVGLDPTRPGLGRLVLGLQLTTPGWSISTDDEAPEDISPHRVAPILSLVGHPVGDAAVRCLRALVHRPDGLEGARCQAILAAQVAAATRAIGASEAITAVLAHDPGPSQVHIDWCWQMSMRACQAALGDHQVVPALMDALAAVNSPTMQAYAVRVMAVVGAVEELDQIGEVAALGWCPGDAGVALVRQRLAESTTPRTSDQEALALLRAGAIGVPSQLELHLAPVAHDSRRRAIVTALGRCGGSAGVASLLTWAADNLQTARWAGQGLALIEDPAALPLLARELSAPEAGRVLAAAVGLASSRLAGASDILRRALARADENHALLLWSAAIGGRDDALAAVAVAEARRRGPPGTEILHGLSTARAPAALVGAWDLAADPTADLELRLAVLSHLPDTNLPARVRALNSILADRTASPEVRATAIIEYGAANVPECRAALLEAAITDPSGWVRACIIFATGTQAPEGFFAARLVEDASPQARCYAAAQLGQTVTDTVALCHALLAEEHPRVRETIARMLAQNAFVAQDEQRTAMARAAAEYCLATETDSAAKAALQALRDGEAPAPAEVGKNSDTNWSDRTSHYDIRTRKSWVRVFWPPRQLTEREDPGLPFGDG